MGELSYIDPATERKVVVPNDLALECADELNGSTGAGFDDDNWAERLGLPDVLDVFIMCEQLFGIYRCDGCDWFSNDCEPDPDSNDMLCWDCQEEHRDD